MDKTKFTHKNRLLTVPKHLYSGVDEVGSSNFLKKALDKAGGTMGVASAAAGAVGGLVGNAISGGLSSGAGNAISGVGNALGAIPVFGGFAKGAFNIVGGGVNALFGMKTNQAELNRVNKGISALNDSATAAAGATSFDDESLMGPDAINFNVNAYKGGLFSKGKARRKNAALQAELKDAYSYTGRTSDNTIGNIADTQLDNALATSAAFGGLLNQYADGGSIHINPENRGKFNATKKRTGKSTEELTHSKNPLTRKRAIFVQNAAKWHHAFGGELNTNGGDFSTGLMFIDEGGTHESNPYEGVPMGIAPDGKPNLVEEGEIIFNDYVFSNRLFADGGLLESFNLPKSYDGYSFAAIAEKLGEESKERPNDPISKRGLLSSMSRLQQAQETVRQQAQEGQEGVQYAHGGRMGTLFDGLGQYPNHLLTIDDDSVPKGTMFDPINNRYVFTGYQDSDAKPLNFGSGITPSGEWVEEPKYMARAAAKRAGYYVGDSLEEYNKTPIKAPEKKKSAASKLLDATNLRYAPVVGATIGLGQNLFSKPDYTSANAILEAANQAGNYIPVGYTPIGNYLQYRPFDRNFYLNKLNAQAGATRRAIMNTTSPSRNAALLAADYNAQSRFGDLARQAEEYNLAQRQAVETFNRGTNQANAEMGLKAAMANQEAALRARSSRLSGVAQAMAVRDAVDARRAASMSANLTNLFDSLGNIGIDAYNREDRDKLIRAGVFGTLSEKPQEWSDKTWKEYKDYINKSLENKTPKVKGKQHSKGGYLTIKKGKQHGKF